MINDNDVSVKVDSNEGVTTAIESDECQAKIDKINAKFKKTADELEEISSLYAKSVKDGLDKAKKIKELEDEIDQLKKQLKACQAEKDELAKQLKDCQDKNKNTGDLQDKIKELEDKIAELEKQLKDCQAKKEELEKQLKDCQAKNEELEKQLKACEDKNKKLTEDLKESQNKREELEAQLKDCQDKNKNTSDLENKIKELEDKIAELEKQLKDCQDKNKKPEGQGQWIIGEYKWVPIGTKMPSGWVKVPLDKGLTLIQGDAEGKTAGDIKKHNHTFLNNNYMWSVKPGPGKMAFINERTSGSLGHKYVPFLNNSNDFVLLKGTGDAGEVENNYAAGIYAELWQYQGSADTKPVWFS